MAYGEQRKVTRARTTRWVLRVVILVVGALSLWGMLSSTGPEWVVGLACFGLFVVMTAFVLFLIDGFAPPTARAMLRERDRRRLDD